MLTLVGRVIQAFIKTALEPEWKCKADIGSYRFRPGRSCHDAIERIHTTLTTKDHMLPRKQWVFYADIKGCFDNISHEYLLTKISTFLFSSFIRHITDGFDFLGCHILSFSMGINVPEERGAKTYGYKLIIEPSPYNPVIRGWPNYHRSVFARKTFESLDAYLFIRCYRYGLRRHPQKGQKWVVKNTFLLKTQIIPMTNGCLEIQTLKLFF